MLAWLYQPARFFDGCRAQYGDIFTMRLPGHAPRVMLARHDDIKSVFTGDPGCLHAGAANALVGPLVGPRSILVLDDAAHLRQRRLLLSLFGGRKVAEHCDAMRRITDEALDAWPVGDEFRLLPEMQAITLRVILATIFGVREAAQARALYPLLAELLDHAKNPLLLVPSLQRDVGPLTPWRRFVALKREIDEALRPIFDARRARPDDAGGDILGQLAAARDEAGELLSPAQLRDELVTLLVAGHETTANALAWTLTHVLARPDVQSRLCAELADVVGDAPVTYDHLDGLAYLDATVSEAQRINPVLAHVGRLLTAPTTVGGYTLPAGCLVVPCIYLAHRDPAVFPDPDRFDPERFLARRFTPYEYLPFGGGTRRCIGMTFALHEMKVVLATILQRAALTARPGHRPRITRRGVVWSPGGGVPVRQRQPPRARAPQDAR